MSVEAVVVDAVQYDPIKVTEERLETLVSAASPAIFPGFQFFGFKPPIRCGGETRHPDGALVAVGSTEWWVVEVETHLHGVGAHIYPQLKDLSEGYYGPDAFAYL